MSYDNQSYNGGKILQSDDTVIDTEQFLESGEIVVTAIATPSAVTTTTDGVVRTYNNFSPTALKVINQDNEIFDLIELLQSGQIKVQLQGGAGELTQGYVVFDTASDGLVSRTLLGSQNIVVENGDGSIGNAVIKLADDVTLTGTLDTNGNAIISPAGEDITLTPPAGNAVDLNSDMVIVGDCIKHKSEILENKISFSTLSQRYSVGANLQFDISSSGVKIGTIGARVNTIDDTGTNFSSTSLMTGNGIRVAIGDAIDSGRSFRGGWDASVNLFPSTGGSGDGGAIEAGNHWIITVAGTLGGEQVYPDESILALIDNPGQTSVNWFIEQPVVSSVFGRVGAVMPEIGDYDFNQLAGTCAGTQGGTGHATTTTNDLLVGAALDTWSKLPSANRAVLKTTELGVVGWSSPLGDGQILIGSNSGQPVPALISVGSGLSMTPSANGILLDTVGASSAKSYGYIWMNTGSWTGDTFSFTTAYQEMSSIGVNFTLLSPSFEFEMTTDGRLKYTGSTTKTFSVNATFSCSNSGSFAMQIYKNGVALAGIEAYETGAQSLEISDAPVSLATNDYISIFLKKSTVVNVDIIQLSLSAIEI
jgi:hypothetical protein